VTPSALAVRTDKIMHGAKPADLSIEQPTKFEFVLHAVAAATTWLHQMRRTPAA